MTRLSTISEVPINVQMFVELFKLQYPYVHIGDMDLNHFKMYADGVDSGRYKSVDQALDLCYDGIMSQGLSDYDE